MTTLPHTRFEAQKVSAKQLSSGDWQMTIRVNPDDFPTDIMKMAPGERLIIAAVPLDENDQPTANPKTHSGRREWGDLSPAQQAGIRCQEPRFREWLASTYISLWERACGEYGTTPDENAAFCVRELCDVSSRADLTAQKWNPVDDDYRADVETEMRG